MKIVTIMALVVMGAGLASAGEFNLDGMDLKAVREQAAAVSVNLPEARVAAATGDCGSACSGRGSSIFSKALLTREEASQELKKIFETANPYFAEVLCGKYKGKLFIYGNGAVEDMNMELVCKSPDLGPLFNAAPELRVSIGGASYKTTITAEGVVFSTSSDFRYTIRQYGDYLIIKENFDLNMVSYGYFWLP